MKKAGTAILAAVSFFVGGGVVPKLLLAITVVVASKLPTNLPLPSSRPALWSSVSASARSAFSLKLRCSGRGSSLKLRWSCCPTKPWVFFGVVPGVCSEVHGRMARCGVGWIVWFGWDVGILSILQGLPRNSSKAWLWAFVFPELVPVMYCIFSMYLLSAFVAIGVGSDWYSILLLIVTTVGSGWCNLYPIGLFDPSNLFHEEGSNRDPLPVQGGTLVIRWVGVPIAVRHVGKNASSIPLKMISHLLFCSIVSGPAVVLWQSLFLPCNVALVLI